MLKIAPIRAKPANIVINTLGSPRKNTTKTPTTWTDSEGKVHTSYETAHSHGAKVNYWLPKVNETVACLYLPTFNGDGVILGAIKT